MPHHLIIGGGPVATNAIETIRQVESNGSEITLVSDEPAHSRMALPYWLSGQFPKSHTYTADEAWYRQYNVDARIGRRVQGVDVQGKSATLDDGSTVGFDNLLIGTGASPLKLDVPGADLPGVQTLWTLADTDELLKKAAGKRRPRIVMIGAGFIGFIMLNAMYKRGWQLAVVEREQHVLPRMLDAGSAALVEDWLRSKGVELYCGTTVQQISQADGDSYLVELASGEKLPADVVIVAVGIRANMDFLDGTGIKTDVGILVNHRMQTNVPYIYAGGDAAQGPVLFSDEWRIHAIQPTAVDHGRVAGANMAGQETGYPGSLAMNILDACGVQCASFGNWDDEAAEAMTISNPSRHIYRKLLWTGDQITGAIFIGQASDMGMLTDVGMVKGIMQTQTPLGPWKEFLKENPFDVRRPYVAARVAEKLRDTTLLGRPSRPRLYRAGGVAPKTRMGPSHAAYVGSKAGN